MQIIIKKLEIPLLKKKHFSLINTVVWYLSFFLLMLYNNVSTVVYYDKNIIFIQIRLQVWKRRQFTSYLWSERIKSNCKLRSKRLANPWLRLIYSLYVERKEALLCISMN